MADRELSLKERNLCRHVRKRVVSLVTEAAREHGVKLQSSDVDMLQHQLINALTGIIKHRSEQNEQAAAQGHQQGNVDPE